METESAPPPPPYAGVTRSLPFLLLNILLLAVGSCGGPLILRLYFTRGGNRIWFSGWLESAGWPIILIPLIVDYTRRRRTKHDDAVVKLILMNPRVFLGAGFVGLLTGLDNYFYAYGLAKLPVSTSSLIVATQLAFTAVFAFFIVRLRFTSYSINAVVLLTTGAAVLGLHASGDKPVGESNREYMLGFILTLAAAAIYGLFLPLVVMSVFATAFCTVGMVVNHDFPAIVREAKSFELGATVYYVVVVFAAFLFQCSVLGIIGVIFYSSSLLSGIVLAATLPVTEILAVVFFKDRFQAEKGVALFLSLWGFVSYFYGERKIKSQSRRAEVAIQHRLSTSSSVPILDRISTSSV